MGKFLYTTGTCGCGHHGHLWERVVGNKLVMLCADCIRAEVILQYGQEMNVDKLMKEMEYVMSI